MTTNRATYEELHEWLLAFPRRHATMLIAIDGPGGSGKSTIARKIGQTGGHAIVENDDFYRPSAERFRGPLEDRPNAADFDLGRLVHQVLAPLSVGRHAAYQRYDWRADRLGPWMEVPPRDVVIVEGIYTTSRKVVDYFDVRIWLECPRETRLRRGVARDGEAARDRWLNEWMPQEDRYVSSEGPNERAQVILFGGDDLAIDPEKLVLVSKR